MQISDAQNKVAGELVDLIANRLGASGRAVHAETAIASAARLAGSLLLRSFDLKLDGIEPGSVVLSNDANQQGPELIGIVSAVLQGFDVAIDPEKLGGVSTNRGEEPELSVEQSLSLLQPEALRIAERHGLKLKESAQSSAVATGFIIRECEASIGGEVGFNVAAYGLIEGCKTVPPSLESQDRIGSRTKPWYKLWCGGPPNLE